MNIIKKILNCEFNSFGLIKKINTKLDESQIPFEKIKSILEIVILSACVMEAVVSLCNAQSEMYQTFKDAHSARAMIYIALFVFIIQKVKLLNWQSLIAMMLYAPIAYKFRTIYIESPDLDVINLSVIKVYAIVLLIVVDMIVYKKYAKSNCYRYGILILFISMFVLVYRSMEDFYLIIPIIVLYFVSINEKQIEKMVLSICLGWIGAAFLNIWESFVINPPTGKRWYGKFLNLGDFGQFLTGAIVASIFLIIYCYKRWKVKSIPFVFSILTLPLTLIATFLSGTRTLYVGLIFVAIVCFIFGEKKRTLKSVVKKCLIICGVCVFVCVLVSIWVNFVMSMDYVTYKKIDNWVIELCGGKGQRTYNWINRLYGFYKLKLEKEPVFDAPMFIRIINYFSSWRIEMWYKFWKASSFKGNGGVGFDMGGHLGFGNNAHSGYFQAIYQYGYIPGALFVLCPIVSMITSGVRYWRTRTNKYLFVLLWSAALLGVMTGEAEITYFPLWVFMLFSSFLVIRKNANIDLKEPVSIGAGQND